MVTKLNWIEISLKFGIWNPNVCHSQNSSWPENPASWNMADDAKIDKHKHNLNFCLFYCGLRAKNHVKCHAYNSRKYIFWNWFTYWIINRANVDSLFDHAFWTPAIATTNVMNQALCLLLVTTHMHEKLAAKTGNCPVKAVWTNRTHFVK